MPGGVSPEESIDGSNNAPRFNIETLEKEENKNNSTKQARFKMSNDSMGTTESDQTVEMSLEDADGVAELVSN